MILLYALFTITAGVLLAGQLGLLRGQTPDDLGVTNGRLKALPATPNAVSSHDSDNASSAARVNPLAAAGLEPSSAMHTLAEHLRDTPGIHVISERSDYIYAQAQTPWLHFVDDVEFWYNPSREVIDVRSASRIGRSDFGTNRKRIEAIRAEWKNLVAHIPHD